MLECGTETLTDEKFAESWNVAAVTVLLCRMTQQLHYKNFIST